MKDEDPQRRKFRHHARRHARLRSGAKVSDIASLDAGAVKYVQICDLPIMPPHNDYAEEARLERRPSGQGEFPLADILRVLSPDLTISVEVPMMIRGEAGEDPAELMRESLVATRQVIEQIQGA